jgi:hypothetical protein
MAATRNPLEEFAWETEQFLNGMDQTLSALERDPSDEKAIVNFTMDIEGVQKSAEGLSLERINILSWHMLQTIEALPQIAANGGHKSLIVSLGEAVSRVLSLAKTSADIGYEPEGDDSRILKALKSMTADIDNNLSNLPESGTIQEPSAKRKSDTQKVSAEKAAPMSASAEKVKQKTETTKARAAEAETRPENKKYSAITREIFNRFADERRDLDVVFLDYQTDWGPNFKRASSITLNLIFVRALLRALPFFQQKYFKYDVSLRHYNHDRDHKAQAFHLINIRYLHYMWLNCLSGGKLKLTRVEPSTNNRVLDEFTNSLVKLLTLRNVDSGSKIRQLLALMHQKGRADIHYKAFVSDVNGLDRERPTWTPLWHGDEFENIKTKGNGLGIWKTWADWYEEISTQTSFDLDLEAKIAEYLANLPEGIPYGNSIADINEKIAEIRAPGSQSNVDENTPTQYKTDQPDYVSDAAETILDSLNRAPLALNLARRLNNIWHSSDKERNKNREFPYFGDDNRRHHCRIEGDHAVEHNSFITLVDSPWGGGKTTFANYLTHILNPMRYGFHPHRIPLDESTLGERGQRHLRVKKKRLGFLARMELNDTDIWPEDYRTPWVIAWHNLWRHEHVKPPWWNFYINIRSQCFHAVRTERSRGSWLQRHLKWANLWRAELWWRFWTPELKAWLGKSLAIVPLAFMLAFAAYGLLYLAGEKIDFIKFFEGTGLSILGLVGIGSGAANLKGWRKLAEGMLPKGNDPNYKAELGTDDPLEGFRQHFKRMMERVGTPVIVIIDDIDRCKAETVTGLVTGLMTSFRSDHVMYLLLGDRRWLEKACEGLHAGMRHDGQSDEAFARRYVEKAIQLAVLLPAINGEARTDYINDILGEEPTYSTWGPRARTPANNVTIPPEGDSTENTEDQLDTEADFDTSNIISDIGFDTGPIADEAIRTARKSAMEKTIMGAQLTIADVAEELKGTGDFSDEQIAAADSAIRENVAIAQSTGAGDEAIRHRLHDLADKLPANPRRMKRIFNMTSAYQASATILFGDRYLQDHDNWERLVRFVILASEHPREWQLLLSDKALAKQVIENPKFSAETIEEKFGTNLGANPGDDKKTDYENHMLFLNREIQALLYDKIPENDRGEDHLTHTVFIHKDALDDFRLLMPIGHR